MALLIGKDKAGTELGVLRKKATGKVHESKNRENLEKQKEQIMIEIGMNSASPKTKLHNYIKKKLGTSTSKVTKALFANILASHE